MKEKRRERNLEYGVSSNREDKEQEANIPLTKRGRKV